VAHHLALHQLRANGLDRRAQHVSVLTHDTSLTTSSIVILSTPAIAGGSFRRILKKSDDHEHQGGRNHVPSEPDLHHPTGRDPKLLL